MMSDQEYQSYIRRIVDAPTVGDVIRVQREAQAAHGADDPLMVRIASTGSVVKDFLLEAVRAPASSLLRATARMEEDAVLDYPPPEDSHADSRTGLRTRVA